MPQSGVAAAAAISLVWARVVVVVVVDAIKVSYIFVKLLIIYFLWTGHVGAVAKSFLFNRPDRNINTFLDYNVIIIIMMMIKTHRVLRCRCSRHRVRCCVIRRNYPVTSALFSLPPRRSRVDKQSVSRHVAIFRTRPQRVGKGGGIGSMRANSLKISSNANRSWRAAPRPLDSSYHMILYCRIFRHRVEN